MFHGIPGGQPWRLTGHPRVLQLPSLVATAGLRRAIAGLLPPRCADAFDLRLVDSQGMRCPRCVYPARCHGCRVGAEPTLSLQPGDSLAVEPSAPAAADWRALFQPLDDDQVRLFSFFFCYSYFC